MIFSCKGRALSLLAYVENSLRPRALRKVKQHLEECSICQESLRRIQSARKVCKQLGSSTDAPPVAWRRVEAQIYWNLSQKKRQPKTKRRQNSALPIVMACSAAACVVIGVLALRIFLSPPPSLPPQKEARPIVSSSIPTPKAPAPFDEEIAAIPTMVRGKVWQRSSRGRQEPIDPSRPLMQGADIMTAAGQTALQWAHRKGALAVEQSHIILQKLRTLEQEIYLSEGKIFIHLAKLKKGESFSIVTDDIRASVRGTFFSVSSDSRLETIDVFTGAVQVESISGRWPAIRVPAHFRVKIDKGATQRPALLPLFQTAQASWLNLLPWTTFEALMAQTSTLMLRSFPKNLGLSFDSRPLGKTDLNLRTTIGRHFVEFWKGDKRVHNQWVDVHPTENHLAFKWKTVKAPSPKPSPIHITDIPARVSQLKQWIDEHKIQTKRCYERRLKRDPTLEGEVVFRIQVTPAGQVSDITLVKDTIPDPWVGQCALHIIERWKLPEGKAEAVLRYPIIFRKKEESSLFPRLRLSR